MLHDEASEERPDFPGRGRHPRCRCCTGLLGTVLGFLLIGLALGPFGLGYLDDYYPFLSYFTLQDPKEAEPLAELGIVFLLFLLGLELSLSRLWQLRRYVLGVGLVQVGVCDFGNRHDNPHERHHAARGPRFSACVSRCRRPRS